MLTAGTDGAAKITNPLRELNEKEEKMVKEGVKQLGDDIKLGSELGKGFGTELQEISL